MIEERVMGQPAVEARQTKLVVIVPAYNEEDKIRDTVRALQEIRSRIAPMSLAVYVVNDGSRDRTRAYAMEAGADRVINHKINLGLGAAVRSGLTAARKDGADIVVKFDADLQHDPLDIPRMIQPILEDVADIVYGNRFRKIEYRMPLVRSMGNKVFTRLMRFLTGWPITDSQPGIFAVNSSYLDVFSLPGDYNYTQQILLDAYHKNMRFAHVDVSFRKRETGRSFVSLKYPFKVLPQIVMVLISVKPLRVFGPIAVVFLLCALAVSGIELVQYFAGSSPKPIRDVNLVLGSGLFGIQTLFFGLLAELVVFTRKR